MANGNENGTKAEAPKKAEASKSEAGPVGTATVRTVDVLAISRSQNIRIGTHTVPSIGGRFGDAVTPLNVDLLNAKARRDLQNHLAFGAVIIVGYHNS